MAKNKNHWYDGWFYDTIIAPNQDKLFGQIRDMIGPDSDIVDIGCGTGRFEFSISGKCRSVLGIDLSERNINRAKKTLFKYPDKKIYFHHGNLTEIINGGDKHFDFAVLTYVIHEVDKNERIDLLKQVAGIAEKIIIGDYVVPKPNGFTGFLSELIEFVAGSDHYRNYKSYMADGGMEFLADSAGLRINSEIKNQNLPGYIVTLSRYNS
jgi:SAM-dependent methyltransferase